MWRLWKAVQGNIQITLDFNTEEGIAFHLNTISKIKGWEGAWLIGELIGEDDINYTFDCFFVRYLEYNLWELESVNTPIVDKKKT